MKSNSGSVLRQRTRHSSARDANLAAADFKDAAHAGPPEALGLDPDVEPIGIHGADDRKFIVPPLFPPRSGPVPALPRKVIYMDGESLINLGSQLRTVEKRGAKGGACVKTNRTRCEQACNALMGALASRTSGKVLKWGGTFLGYAGGMFTAYGMECLLPRNLLPLTLVGGTGYTLFTTYLFHDRAQDLHFKLIRLRDRVYPLDDELGPLRLQLNNLEDLANITAGYLFVTHAVDAPAAVIRVNDFLFHAYLSFFGDTALATVMLPKEYLDAGWDRSDGLSETAHRLAQVRRLFEGSVADFDYHDPATSPTWKAADVDPAAGLRASDFIFVAFRLDAMIGDWQPELQAGEIFVRTAEVDVSEQVKTRVRDRQP